MIEKPFLAEDPGPMYSPGEKDLTSHEMQYFDSFVNENPELFQFVQCTWNLSSGLFDIYAQQATSQRQKISMLFLVKSARILRSIAKLTVSGYASEAKILLRSHMEMKGLLVFLLREQTDSRLSQWIKNNNPKNNVWPWKQVDGDLLGAFGPAYDSLSQSVHFNVASFGDITMATEAPDKVSFYFGPVHNRKEEASKILSLSAFTNGSIVELAYAQFPTTKTMDRGFSGLYETPWYKITNKAINNDTLSLARDWLNDVLKQPRVGKRRRLRYLRDEMPLM